MRDRLWLVRNGVPFRMAFGLAESDPYSLSDADVAAFAITFSIFEGGDFDMNTMTFKESK